MSEGEDGYDNRNRAFLQAFIARSALTFEESKPILASILSACGEFYHVNGVLGDEKHPLFFGHDQQITHTAHHYLILYRSYACPPEILST